MSASEAKQEIKQEEIGVAKHQTQELTEVFSASFPADVQLSGNKWARVNLTVKHGIKAEQAKADFDNLVQFLDLIANDGNYVVFVGDLRSPFPPMVAVNGDGEVVEHKQPVNGKKEYPNEFKAGRLTATSEKGKIYFKVEGEEGARFPKYPVTIWPEVLEHAGINADEIPVKGMPLTGWTAVYEKNEKGYPAKVIELRQPDFMQG